MLMEHNCPLRHACPPPQLNAASYC